MVFAPKLEGGVAYEQPVQQPNAMSAIADLFNFGLDTMSKQAANTPKLTEDERFAVAVKDFEESKGATFNWDRKGMREFIFTHPQFTTQAKTYAENLGVMTVAPEEVARDAAVEWFKTPEGMMAVAATEGMEPEERDAELARRVTTVKQQEAELAKLTRETAILEAEGTLDAKRWDVLKPTSKDMVDDTVSTILAPIFQEVSNGVSVEVPEELKQQLGIRYDTIDMNNINAVLADTKNYLSRQTRGTYSNNFGEDLLPSDDWNKEVFASLDSLIEVGKAIDSPQERAAAMQALIESEAYKRLDAGGIAVSLEIIKKLPPESAAGLLALPTLDGPLKEILAPNGTLFGSKEIADAASNLSTKEAQDVANDTIQIIDKGITPEFFTAFKESAKRSGYNVVDSNSFKSIIGNNVAEINRLSSVNPEFRAEMTDFLNSDIQQTISIVKSNLPPVVDLVVVNGKMAMVIKPESRKIFEDHNKSLVLSGLPAITDEEYIKSQTRGLPDGMNLNTLNEKLGALGLLGDVGKEVQEAIGILNQPEKTATREITARGKGRGRGSSSSSSSGSGNFVVDGLVSRGMAPHIAEGFAMNFKDESAFNPTAVGDGGNAYGLAQWNGPRKRALENFAASVGGDVSDPEVQMDFLMYELGGPESEAWQKIQNAKTAGEAAAIIVSEFERPAKVHEDRRRAEYLGGNSSAGAASMPAQSGSEASPTLSLDSGASEVPQGARGAVEGLPARLEGNLISFDSPEVQQLVASSQSNPEETVKAAKELLAGKPMDPQVKALIEALVRIGERA
jgi:hypothetical protein